MPIARGQIHRLNAIDGLRAVAVLAVVFYHFGFRLLPSGYTGVDIFFVISGYVISRSLALHGGATSLAHYVGAFYKRRILRLLPALFVCLCIVSLLAVMFIPPSFLSDGNRPTAVLAFFGLGNIALLNGLDGYFDARAEHNPFVHTWSLGVEEQFYLIFPALFWLWLRDQDRPAGSVMARLASRGAIPALALVSLVLAAYETTVSQPRAFYGLPSRFWELAAGAMLYQWHSAGRLIPRSGYSARLAAGAGLLLLAFGFVAVDSGHFPFPGALVPVLGTLSLICAGRASAGKSAIGIRALESRAMVYLGRISYSIYLWHWPVACLLKWTVGFVAPLTIGIGLLLTLLLGAASYHFVEQTFLRWSSLSEQRAWRVIVPALALSVLMAAGVNRLYETSGLPFKLYRVARESGWIGWNPDYLGPLETAHRADPSLRPRKLYVLGDSHAAAYQGMVMRAAARADMDLQMMSVSGCPVADLMQGAETGPCNSRVREMLDYLQANAKRGDIVFLASLRAYRLAEQSGLLSSQDLMDRAHQQARQAALASARELVQRLESTGMTVIVDYPKPMFRAPLFRCVDWFNRMNPVCEPGFTVPASLLRERDAPVRESLRALKSEFSDLVLWDPFPILCPGETCSAIRDGKPLFFDQDHLSGYGNLALEQSFTELLEGILKSKSSHS
jgi:peptidoglycan/LPS O-acetylase OafA/YrhL